MNLISDAGGFLPLIYANDRSQGGSRSRSDRGGLIALYAFSAFFCLLTSGVALNAQGQSAATELASPSGSIAELSVVRWSGTLSEAAGQTVQLRFALFEDQAGGFPIWSETQQVKIGVNGSYTVLLGETSAEGVPLALFQGGQARWIEARLIDAGSVFGAQEVSEAHPLMSSPSRSLLAVVPYAFKAKDAETLAGRGAEDYVTRDDLHSAVTSELQTVEMTCCRPLQSKNASDNIGAPGIIPVWNSQSGLGNSALAEYGANIGIGTTTPATMLDVNGASTLRSTVSLLASAATMAAGIDSPALQLGATTYSSATKTSVQQNFAWQAVSTGNDTPNPSANLTLLFGSGSTAPTPTGLSISPNGLINFAPGQTFPNSSPSRITNSNSSPNNGSNGGGSGSITAVTNGGTGATTPSQALVNLGAASVVSTATQTFAGPINFASSSIAAASLANLGGQSAMPGLTSDGSNGIAVAGNFSAGSVGGIVYANPSTPGTTTAGINEALDSFGAVPACGIVQMPKGSYTITGTIGDSHISGRDGCILRGHGAGFSSSSKATYLTWAGGNSGTMMHIVQCQHCITADFSLDGGGTAGTLHWVDTNSSMTQVNNVRLIHGNSTSVAFQMGSSSGVVPGETHYSNVFIENVGTCWYVFGEGTADGRVDGSNVCVPTIYGVHVGSHTEFQVQAITFSSYGGGPITLFQEDAGAYSLLVDRCYGEEFTNIFNVVGTTNNSGPNLTILNSGFDPQSTASGISIGSYTANGSLVIRSTGIAPGFSGAHLDFNPPGNRGSGYFGILTLDTDQLGNLTISNSGVTGGNADIISHGTFGGPTGSMSWYPSACQTCGSASDFLDGGHPLQYLDGAFPAFTDGKNTFSSQFQTNGGNGQLAWNYNSTVLGGWNFWGTPTGGTWTAYDFVMFDALKGSNGQTLIPASAASYQGSATGGPLLCAPGGTSSQFCGGDGAWHTPATTESETVSAGSQYFLPFYTAAGSATTLGPTAISVDSTGKNISTAGNLTAQTGINVYNGACIANINMGGSICFNSDGTVSLADGAGTLLYQWGLKTTYSGLPTCSPSYETAERSITDSTTQTWGAPVSAGGGSYHVEVRCNGTNWTVVAI
ncbi:MAG TPA: hypothetical protein VKR52_10970 [Terracidiphilus sp.]|nr:hypothetical protein [Terracidiphilus sp.]